MSERIVNGRVYPMWNQFVAKAQEWVDGTLSDLDEDGGATQITGISLEPNGADSAFFCIHGKRFDCGFDVQHGAVDAIRGPGIHFIGFGGHRFHIEKPKRA